MLEVQKYLKSGKSIKDLTADFNIKPTFHDTEDLVILNYDQIESPKTNPIVEECRGLVLHKINFDVIAKSFNRFYNLGEVQDKLNQFNWNDFTIESKEDGSLILIYYFNGQWFANTRGSFGNSVLYGFEFEENSTFTWRNLICSALKINDLQDLNKFLNPNYTYVCELVSPYNKIVRYYKESFLYLLTIFEKDKELTIEERNAHQKILNIPFLLPSAFYFKTKEEILDYIHQNSSIDQTFEGVIIRDNNNNRWKIKSKTYVALHHLKGNNNLFNPKHHIPLILAGELDEVLTFFPEAKEKLFKTKAKIEKEWKKVERLWQNLYHLGQGKNQQKDFALAIADKTKVAGILFSARQSKLQLEKESKQKIEYETALIILEKIWASSSDLLYKILFQKEEKC